MRFKTRTCFCDWNWLGMASKGWKSHFGDPKPQQWSFGNSYASSVLITENRQLTAEVFLGS